MVQNGLAALLSDTCALQSESLAYICAALAGMCVT